MTSYSTSIETIRLSCTWLWCFSATILKCDIKMNCGLNNNSGIQFDNQENNKRLKYPSKQLHVPKWNYFRFSGAILNFRVTESPDKVSLGTVEKLTLENMGISFGILSLSGTEPEIHLGVIYPPSPIATYVLKNTIATLGLKCVTWRNHAPFRDGLSSVGWD